MDTALPPPLVPAFVELQDFSYMPLDVRRLRDSRLAARSTGEEFMAAVLLWCASWHQQPAASLPDDDVELAQLAGFGRAVEAWTKVREGALHGWIKCADGRLYHPVIAEKAVESWNEKTEHRHKREVDRLRKENLNRKEQGVDPLPIPVKPLRISVHTQTGIQAEERNDSDGIPPEQKQDSGGIPAPAPKEFPGIPGLRERESKGKGKVRDTVSIETDARAMRAALGEPQLPDWLPKDAWRDWVNYRKSHKAQFSVKAAELSLRELAKLREQGFDPPAVIEQSILSGWAGLFPLKSRTGSGPNGFNKQAALEARNARAGRQAEIMLFGKQRKTIDASE